MEQMQTQNNKRKHFSVRNSCLIILEALLYITFMYTDIVNSFLHLSSGGLIDSINGSQIFNSSHLKFYSIVLCLVFSIISLCMEANKITILLTSVFSFTVIADFFLLLKSDNVIPGIASFCVVHFIYLLIIKNGNLKSSIIPTFIRIVLAVTVTFALSRFGIIDFPKDTSSKVIIFLSLLYAFSFIGNIVRLAADKFGCAFSRPSMFLTGLILFLLCDVNVLIYNLGNYIKIDLSIYPDIRKVSSILMWGFYLPSQVIIALSAVRMDKIFRVR